MEAGRSPRLEIQSKESGIPPLGRSRTGHIVSGRRDAVEISSLPVTIVGQGTQPQSHSAVQPGPAGAIATQFRWLRKATTAISPRNTVGLDWTGSPDNYADQRQWLQVAQGGAETVASDSEGE